MIQHLEPIAGSPLLPPSFILGYSFGILFLLALIYLGLHLFSRHIHTRVEFKTFAALSILALLIVFFYAIYLLVPTPQVSAIKPLDGESNISLSSPIQIQFNRPVSRRVMEKSISPDAPGVWVFEKPFYATHLYRALTFYPSRSLNANTNYKITLSNVRSVTQRSQPYAKEFSFTTQDYPRVSGITAGEVIKVDLNAGNDGASDFVFDFTPKVDFSASLSSDKNQYIITPTKPLVKGQTYSFVVKKVNLAWDFLLNEIIGKSSPVTEVSGQLLWEGDDLIYTSAPVPKPVAPKQDVELNVKTFKLNVPSYLQQHTLSCEVSSLRMTLAYKGLVKSEEELLDLVGYDNTPHEGNVWGNPYEHFVGNVDGRQMRDGYGVYWGPIERVAKMFGEAKAFQNGNVGMLTGEILNGNPVIIWVYSKSGAPTSWVTPTGVEVFAVAGEHTVVAVGFVGPADNPTQIIVNDPLVGQVYWPRALFDRKWATFSQSGVVIYK